MQNLFDKKKTSPIERFRAEWLPSVRAASPPGSSGPNLPDAFFGGDQGDGEGNTNVSQGDRESALTASRVDTAAVFPPRLSSPIDIRRAEEVWVGDRADGYLRNWCTGHPLKVSYLPIPDDSLPFFHFLYGFNSTDMPELDKAIDITKVLYGGRYHLPLSAHALHLLSPLWGWVKPITNFGIFERIVINKDINTAHADHAIVTLEYVGVHCKHLVVKSPIPTTRFGGVFDRKANNIDAGNDWDKILARLPNLESVSFDQPAGEPTPLTQSTLHNLQDALNRANRANLQTINMIVQP